MIVNGRFLHAEPGGFRRYAMEVSNRLPDCHVLSPPRRMARGMSGKAWEQTALLREASHDVLWSPIGSGPIGHPRHVVTVHDLAAFTDPDAVSGRFAMAQRWLVPRLVAAAAAIIVDSDAVGGELADRFDLEPSKLSVVPPGISQVFRDVGSMSKQEAAAEFGFGRGAGGENSAAPLVGGLVSSIPRKNSPGLLEALDLLATDGDIDLVVAGFDGPTRVFGRGQRPRATAVRDLGSLTDRRLALFYRALDVFVWLPDYEGFGLPVVECAAAGTPVVCTPVPAAVERLGTRVAVVDGVSAAVSAVRDLVGNPDLMVERGAGAMAAVEDLTWENTATLVQETVNRATEVAA